MNRDGARAAPEPQEAVATALVGIGEAARALGVSRTTMQKMADGGMLDSVRTAGGHRRILRQSLMRYLRERASAPGADVQAPGQLRLLVVDGEPAARERLVELVASWELPVGCLAAADAVEALLLIERHRPQVLVTEVDINPFDGVQLLRLVASQPGYAVPWVAVHTRRDPHRLRSGGELPATIPILPKEEPGGRLRGYLEACVQREIPSPAALTADPAPASAGAGRPVDGRWARDAGAGRSPVATAS